MPKKAKKGKPKPKESLTPSQLRKWYEDALAEKDREIARLKKENDLLLATALRQGARTKEIFEKAQKAFKKK